MLVFRGKQPMVGGMDLLSLCRRFLFHAPVADREATCASADPGDADAQFGLGLKYGSASGSAQDLVAAAQWFRKAADQNHYLAQFNLGMMLAQGQGMPRDDMAALIWFRKAAEGGDGGAQYILGMRYHRSSVDALQMDATESRIEAYKWFCVSAAQGYKGSQAAGERVSLAMSREEVAEGNRRAAMFVARPVGSAQDQ